MKSPFAVPLSPDVDLSVVIVTHRTRDVMRNCLHSLYAGGGLRGLRNPEVILVDNASGDGTREMAQTQFPQVRLLANDDNVGFTVGNNQGIAVARGRCVLLLNPDTLVPDGTLARCVAALDTQPATVAGLSCRVHSPDGSIQHGCARRLPTPWSEACRALLLDRALSGLDWFNRERYVGWDKQSPRRVPCIHGCFMLMRRTALEKIGGFDERFFLTYEEIDLCRRAHDAGMDFFFWPAEHITHIGGQWTRQEPVVSYANTHVSALLYFGKHHPRSVGVLRAVIRVGMEMKIALLRLYALRHPRDERTRRYLSMTQGARQTLRTGQPIRYGQWTTGFNGGGNVTAPAPVEGA